MLIVLVLVIRDYLTLVYYFTIYRALLPVFFAFIRLYHIEWAG